MGEKPMKDFQSITVTKGEKDLIIDNPTDYPMIGMGAQSAVFKLSEEQCVKIYSDPEQAQMELEALKAGQHLLFFPRLYDSGKNYVVMEYFNAPTLKEYLRNCTYIPESITKKLLFILSELRRAKFTTIDAALRHIFVLENEELKIVDFVNAFKRMQPAPLKLLRDLNIILLKESFLSRVKILEPKTYKEWEDYINQNKMDYRNIPVTSGGSGKGVKVDSAISQTLIGAGHQGAVYRVDENKCVKIYGNPDHAKKEQDVLLSNQDLSFIPKVYEKGTNYVVMEYLVGPDLNTYLKKQSKLPVFVTERLLDILKAQEEAGFKQIDAPLRHVFVTKAGFKMVDHVYSYSRIQARPLELFQNMHERGFLDSFLEQVKTLDSKLHAEWTKTPIPLTNEEIANSGEVINIDDDRKRDHGRKKGHDKKDGHGRKRGHDRKDGRDRKDGHGRKRGHDRKDGRDRKKGHDRKDGHDRRKGHDRKDGRDRKKGHDRKDGHDRKKGSDKRK
jgi:RIO-like serine/threonine protein kinase